MPTADDQFHSLSTQTQLAEYLRDPFLNRLYGEVRRAGPLKSILVDITHQCNLRCKGCFFFAEGMDARKAPEQEADFDAFVARELDRGTNFITVAGGEPTLFLSRVEKLYRNFWVVVTNGLRKIPVEGFENMPIALSVWGDHATDTFMRGNGRLDVFARGLKNYAGDSRVSWYYTTSSGNAHEIPAVVEQCVQNGNYITFNFYGDIQNRLGGAYDHRAGYDRVCDEIERAIDRYPGRVLTSAYLARVVGTGTLMGQRWGYDVCGSVSADNPINAERIRNGNPYSAHFRAYYPDLVSTRRCCVGEERDCNSCTDLWAHWSWIMMNGARHLSSRQTFTNWLTAVYLFYLSIHAINFDDGATLLPELHRRIRPTVA